MSERVNKDAMACNKPRRTPGHPTKSHVVKACYDGKEKVIRFGEQGASTAGKPKEGESERMKTKRASFKARHAKNIAKGPSSPAYWANKVKWAEGGEVKMARGGNAAMALLEQMRRTGQSPEFDAVAVSMREQRNRPRQRPPAPQQARVPQAAPQPREAPLPLPPIPPSMRPDENPPPEAPRNPMRFDEGNPHVATAIQMAQKYGLPTNVFLSLVQQESRFDPNARSSRGAIGLGQLMPGTARELGVDPTDPVQNLEGSARYLRQMLDRFGDMPLALAAYNAGPGTVRRAGNTIPNIRETQQYVPSILRRAGANVPEGLADLEQKYAEGGRVRRTLRDELRDIEAEIRGERPASMGVTIARGFGEGAGGMTSVGRRMPRGKPEFFSLNEGPGGVPEVTRISPERMRELQALDDVVISPQPEIMRVYHAGAEFDTPSPGLFTNPDRAAVESFQQNMRAPRLHELEISPRNIAGEEDVYDVARRYNVYMPDTPAGQYLEQGENAVFDEAADILAELRRRGFDSARLDDGMGPEPSIVVLDPSIVRRYAHGGLAHLEQKYAEGGQVDAGPAQYNADAVDALVKQIEAEYV